MFGGPRNQTHELKNTMLDTLPTVLTRPAPRKAPRTSNLPLLAYTVVLPVLSGHHRPCIPHHGTGEAGQWLAVQSLTALADS